MAKKQMKSNINHIDEDHIKCPICNAAMIPGSEEYCSHYLCATEGGEFLDSVDFSETTEELYSLVDQIDFEDEHRKIISKAPKTLRKLFEAVRDDCVFYWSSYPGVKSLDYETDNIGIGFAGRYYFHLTPERFVTEITEEAERGIGWLRDHIDELE